MASASIFGGVVFRQLKADLGGMARHASSEIVIYATDLQGNAATIAVDRDTLLDFLVEKLLPVYNSHWRDSSARSSTARSSLLN
jgi:hypothetical protein